jgi:sugar/nucleoside kinase (ribokinase family)
LCLITPDGERTFCFHAGASSLLRPSDLATVLPPLNLSAGDLVYLDAYNLMCPGVRKFGM